jgi:hypothetical protein
VRHALAYVLLNARRHLAKLGRRLPGTAEIDPASSGRWFDGWSHAPHALRASGVACRPSADPSCVALSRTWLLHTGWRRHGLIDPAEVPGAGAILKYGLPYTEGRG